MPIEKIFEIIAAGGPTAIALIMALFLYKINEERMIYRKRIEEMYAEKEEIYREWKQELEEIRERALTGLAAATSAVQTGSSNMESMKQTLTVLTTYSSRDNDRRAG